MSEALKQTLALQWKASRWPLLPFVVMAFGLPLAAIRSAVNAEGYEEFGAAETLIGTLQNWVPLFPILAALVGVTLGLAAWSWDHRANHVYALSLPVTRTRYVMLKFVTGAALLLIPTVAVLVSVLLGRAGIDLPEGLHAYPLAFTARFLLGALIVYALAFALAAGTMRTAIWMLTGFLAVMLFGGIVVGFLRDAFGMQDLPTPIELLFTALVDWPGPFHVFGGNWMPIDV
ncbi:MAG TPA: ABC-2 transporter permease [Thermoanaerobaculia bacterium]